MAQARTKAARRSPPIRGASLLPGVIALLFSSLQVLLSRAAESYLKRLPEPQKSRILAALESLGR
jgi:hypothetical protein